MKLVEKISALPDRRSEVLRPITPKDPNYLSPKELSKKLSISDSCREAIERARKARNRDAAEAHRVYLSTDYKPRQDSY